LLPSSSTQQPEISSTTVTNLTLAPLSFTELVASFDAIQTEINSLQAMISANETLLVATISNLTDEINALKND
jgi:hypothetical protein